MSQNGSYMMLPLESLKVDDQPMPEMFAQQRKELKDSIALYGMLEPLQVRKNGSGYIVRAGRNRYAIAKELGLQEVPCLAHAADDAPENDLALTHDVELCRRHMDEDVRKALWCPLQPLGSRESLETSC